LDRAETAEAKFKKLEMEGMLKDQELASLQHKVSNLEADLEAAEKKISDAKVQKEEEESNKSTNENLNRKIALLESELDNAEKNLRETTDK
jgi:tropomyosin